MAELPLTPDPMPFIERRIHKTLAERRRKRSGTKAPFLSMSQIGDCERNLWAGLNAIEPDKGMEPKLLMIFEFGHTIEEHVVELLRSSGYLVVDRDPQTGQQFHLTDHGDRFRGRTDGQIEIGSRQKRMAVLEIKSANAKQYDYAREVGIKVWKPTYFDQAQVYMGYSGIDECMFIVYAKNTSELYAERIRLDPGRFHELRQKAGLILESEKVLPRPAEAKSQYCEHCKWCPRNQWCWGPLSETSFDK